MSSAVVGPAVDRLLCAGSFFVAQPGILRIARMADETVRWEIFRGHLLAPRQARAEATFASWHVFLDMPAAPATEPLISIRLERARNQVFVSRQILTYGHEAYEDSPGVILSRPVQKWVAELVGTIEPERIEGGHVADELATLVQMAIIGTSRLPITSLESPLPEFSLGRLAYLPELSDSPAAWSDALQFLMAALDGRRPLDQQAKALETALRAEGTSVADLAEVLTRGATPADCGADWTSRLFRALFGGVALSPYTRFADALVGLVVFLADAKWFGLAAALDTLGYMLRYLCRHLTAFDLTLFHNFGANYPDALFLQALLAGYLELSNRSPDLILDATPVGRRRRRALRQACLVRRHYEGHAVPDAPTSMGENTRVLPQPFARVPEDQILEPHKRRRKLFADRPTEAMLDASNRRLLEAGLADLDQASELRELGTALFLDRPLGALKEPGEVDRTPLLSYEAFSRSIAAARITQLHAAGWIDERRRDDLLAKLSKFSLDGLPMDDLVARERPGVVSVADARKAAADFLLTRTTRGSLDGLLAHYDLTPLGNISTQAFTWLTGDPNVLFVQHAPPGDRPMRLRAYCGGRLRLELGVATAGSTMALYRQRGGVELVERLFVEKVWEADGDRWTMRELGERSVILPLKP